MLKSVKAIGLLGLLLCMTLFISVGYAAFSDYMQIDGTAQYTEPELVYIKDVRYVSKSNSNVTGNPEFTKVGPYLTTIKHNDFTLKYQQNGQAGGSVTFEVTVRNNSGVEQYFAGYATEDPLPSTHQIDYVGIALGDTLEHNSEITFRITIHNTSSSSWWQNGEDIRFADRIGKIKFSPNYDDSFSDVTVANIAAIFSSVLAGTGIDGQGTGIYDQGTYIPGDRILSHIKSEYMGNDGGGTGGYTGNVGDASQEVKDLMYAIFGDNMLMQIGNQYYSVSFLIKNQRINHNNDMVLYFTPDPLLLGGGSYINGRTDRETANCYRDLNMVPVYALVFAYKNGAYESLTDENGEPFVFSGEAPVCDMEGGMGAENTDNFNTNIWNSLDYPALWDESGGSISSGGNSRNGELDEAYKKYIGGEKPVTSN